MNRHRKVLELSPEFYDAELTIGLQNYVIGSLSLPLKMLAKTVGVSGSKKRGLKGQTPRELTRGVHSAQFRLS